MKRLLIIALLTLVGITAAFGAGAKEDGVITVATDATWPPMEYIDANKQIVGFDVDRLRIVGHVLKLRVCNLPTDIARVPNFVRGRFAARGRHHSRDTNQNRHETYTIA